MTNAEFRALCIEFDRIHGEYPNHEYEGLALWEYAKNRKQSVDLYDDKEVGDWADEIELLNKSIIKWNIAQGIICTLVDGHTVPCNGVPRPTCIGNNPKEKKY